jgi:hypothetical protein
MTGENRNVWYLGVVLTAFLTVQAGTGYQLLAAATGMPVATVAVSVYDLCEETCGPNQNCEEPCFPEPETGLITCGDYEDGWEGGWCLVPCSCGDGVCDMANCHEATTGQFCCESDCGSCSGVNACNGNSDCSTGYVCNSDHDCVPISDEEPEPPESPVCGGACDDDCCGGDKCYGDPAGGWCGTPTEDECPNSPACPSSSWCNGLNGQGQPNVATARTTVRVSARRLAGASFCSHRIAQHRIPRRMRRLSSRSARSILARR